MRGIYCGILIGGLVCGSGPAHAFGLADETTTNDPFGTAGCELARNVTVSSTYARVALFYVPAPPGVGMAGGSFFLDSIRSNNLITTAAIASCLQADEANVTNLEQNGPDGTFADDTYIGFRFKLAEDAGGWPPERMSTGLGQGLCLTPSRPRRASMFLTRR